MSLVDNYRATTVRFYFQINLKKLENGKLLSEHLHSKKLAQPKRLQKIGKFHNQQGMRSAIMCKKWITGSTLCWVIEGHEEIKKWQKIQSLIQTLNVNELEAAEGCANEYVLIQQSSGGLSRNVTLFHSMSNRLFSILIKFEINLLKPKSHRLK